MPAHRFFLETPFTPTVHLTGEEFHHLKNVMRARPGDALELVNGKGSLALAKLDTLHKEEAILHIEKTTQAPPPSTEIILAQALTRPALLDWIIEKGTELGASRFWLFPGEQSEKKELTSHQLERLHHLAISGLKQCGRLYLPTIETKPPLSAWKKPPGTLLYGSLKERAKKIDASYPSPIIMVIGPEKGFTAKEQTLLETTLEGVGVSLNSNILRAETAALCALSVLAYQCKD